MATTEDADTPTSEEDTPAPHTERRVRLVRRPIRRAKGRRVRLVKSATKAHDDDGGEPTSAPLPPDEANAKDDSDDDSVLFDGTFDEFDLGEETERVRGAASAVAEAVIPEILKRVVAASGDAINEEKIKGILSESMPKMVATTLLGRADFAKKEFYRVVAGEVQRFLGTINVAGELQKILTSLSFEIRTEVRFIPNDQAVVKPKVKNRVKVKWTDDNK
jgi:hypothetical protein